MSKLISRSALWAALCLLLQVPGQGAVVQVQVKIENLAPTGSIAFAPLRLGFHAGVYDSFDGSQAAGEAIISIAEGGSGSAWFPAFGAAEPAATLGTVVPEPAGPLLPGGMASQVFAVDTAVNRYLTFGSMVVPSNDHFVGNDSPMQYELFDAGGQLNLTSIVLTGGAIWDAGSEATDPLQAAFLEIGTNALRTPQNGVVSLDFQELNAFNGLNTAAGYEFDSQLSADLEVYRVSFQVVSEPATALLTAWGILGGLLLRRGLVQANLRQ